MKIYETSKCKEFEALAQEWAEDRLIVHISEEACVWAGQLKAYDEKACKDAGLDIATGEYLGGSIVCFPGDLSLCLVTWGNSMPDFGEDCMGIISELLEAKGAAVERDNNDVLADGKKVASWARATTIKGWVQTVVHYSINTDLELIKAICTKPMEKIPGALSEYGISAEDIWQEIKDKEEQK